MTTLTIGLPVYNGARLLRRSLDRLLAQTLEDFVLIVNDNASTDETAAICAEYCARDARVRYYRNDENVSWYDNFRIVLARAETPYFMWATHDDLWEPDFARANVAQLQANPGAVCSVSKIIYFLDGYADSLAADTGPLTGTPARRFTTYLRTLSSCGRLYGVYRTEALKRCWPEGLYIFGADWLAVGLTLLEGDHLEVDNVLLRREAQPPGYYFQRFGRIDRFRPGLHDRIVPLHRFNQQLKARLPSEVWSAIQSDLSRLNRGISISLWASYAPFLKPPLRFVRRLLNGDLWRDRPGAKILRS